ncbi:MAG: hypothetical protein V4805_00900 [Pseudomonadota bacterium]
MADAQRSSGEIIEHGTYGAFLGGLIVFCILLFTNHFQWSYVIAGAVTGFIVGAFFGPRAIEWLKELWIWT